MMTSNSTESLDESWRRNGTAASPDDFLPHDTDPQGGAHIGDVYSPLATDENANGLNWSSNDAGDPEPLQLPPSTHSLLFTQPILSLPFAFSAVIAIMSIACLFLALLNTMDLENGPHDYIIPNLPVNVPLTVQVAQYFGIFIVLLMEEEIPTGIHLLRMIPRPTFQEQFPDLNYQRFLFSSVLRIVMGLLFLFNVFIVLAQAKEVIDIFYDVLALQFIQQLDDIAFALAKMDVLGKGMNRACTAVCFQTEFQRKKSGRSLRSKRSSIFLKALYFMNLAWLLTGMALLVTTEQNNGSFQVESITVDFGNVIWENALVKLPADFHKKWLEIYPWFEGAVTPDEFQEWTLVYSYFNGVYEQDPVRTRGRRPVYIETRKIDRTTLQKFDGQNYELIVPAEIYYCKGIGAWVFSHKFIQKSNATDEEGCNWLLRSEDTEEYDLMNVGMNWRVWNGVVGKAEISYVDNECVDETDCNFNGQCINGNCKCNDRKSGVHYLGSHCEVSLKDECETIIGEKSNTTYSVTYYNSGLDPDGAIDTVFQKYSRPTYSYLSGVSDSENDLHDLHYVGNRWFGTSFSVVELISKYEFIENYLLISLFENHAFWARDYDPRFTKYVSDETKKGIPVGVDLYQIREHGGQFGPFGALYPIQEDSQPGRGYFRCGGSLSSLGNVSATGRMLQVQNLLGNNVL